MNCGELSLADQQKQWTTLDSVTPKNIQLQAGVYRAGDRLLAVNRPLLEDEPDIIEAPEAEKLFAGVSFQMLQDQGKKSEALQGEIWRLFLFGMLLFLVGESILILPGKIDAAKNRTSSKKSNTEVTV